MGLVSQVFDEEDLALPARPHRHRPHALQHRRRLARLQRPADRRAATRRPASPIALAHNGNLDNAEVLREDLEAQGVTVRIHRRLRGHRAPASPTRPAATWEERFHYVMRRIEGAYSLVVMTRDALFAVRDPMGVRPLCIGRIGDNGWVVASEILRARTPRARVRTRGPAGRGRAASTPTALHSFFPSAPAQAARSAPSSTSTSPARTARSAGKLVYRAREEHGRRARARAPGRRRHRHRRAGLGDAGRHRLRARSRASPIARGSSRTATSGRTFIQPDQRIREAGRAA